MKRLLLSAVFLFFVMPAAAQDSPPANPLLDLMLYVPEDASTRSAFIYYQDFRAAEASREYLSRPANAEAFLNGDIPLITATGRWYGAPADVPQSLVGLLQAEDPSFVEAMGFDFFAINRTLTFGNPPEQGVVWSGDFDTEAIAAAHSARGYSQTAIAGVPAWCGPMGCDSGMMIDMEQMGFPNLFSASLPRQVPFLVPDDSTLVSATALPILESAAEASAGVSPISGSSASIVASSDYRVLAQAVADPAVYSGQLVSAIFLPALDVALPSISPDAIAALIDPNLSAEERQALRENLDAPWYLADYGALPLYLNVVIADRQEGEMQVALIALAYDTVAAAEAGAAELAARLTAFNDGIRLGNPVEPPLVERWGGLAEIRHRVHAPEGETFSAAVVEVWYPQASAQLELAPPNSVQDAPLPTFQAAFYRWMIQAIFQRGFYPLWSLTN